MLDHYITLYIPSKKNTGQPITESARNNILELARKKMSTYFGGTTSTQGLGTWLKDDQLITEKVTLIKAFTDAETLSANETKIKELAGHIATMLSQDCVSLEIDNKLDFIAPIASEKTA